jgi:hypothetical protein
MARCGGKGSNPHVLACGGDGFRVHGAAERGTAAHCRECARVRAAYDGPLRKAIGERYGWSMHNCRETIGCTIHDEKSWSFWNSHEKPGAPGGSRIDQNRWLIQQEWDYVASKTSTAINDDNFVDNLRYATWDNGFSIPWLGSDSDFSVFSTTPVAEQDEKPIVLDEELKDWLEGINPSAPAYREPKGETAKSGIVYIGVNERAWPGWVVSGKTSSADRLSGYQTGDPYREYSLIAAAVIENGLSDAERLFQRDLNEAANRRGVPSSTGDSEWFEIDIDLAVSILSELDGISSFIDHREGA